MLEIKDLSFRHKGVKEDLLKNISFNAQKGQITTILGPNGSGKTTLFKCIVGFWKPSKGDIIYEGSSIRNLSYSKRAKILSIVPQEHEPPFPYSVFEVVLMGRASHLGIFSTPSKRDYEIAEKCLEIVGIFHLKDKSYTKISGGERQLTLIARALAQQAPIMLLDEPTSHLDFRNQIVILMKIKEIAINNSLVILMTLHDPNMAGIFSDKLIVINSGLKIAEGKPHEIISEGLIKKIYGVEVIKIKFDGYNLIQPKI